MKVASTDPLAPSPAAASPEQGVNDHGSHGRVTAEDYPNMSPCPCAGGARQVECAAAGCGYCTAARGARVPADPCSHPRDEMQPLSGAGWVCCWCGAECTPPADVLADLTPDRLDDLDRRAREAAERARKATAGPWEPTCHRVVQTATPVGEDEECADVCEILHYGSDGGAFQDGTATFIAAAREDVPALAAAVLALSAEVRRMREPPKLAPGQTEDVEHLALLALAEPDEEGDCLRCHRTMVRPDRSEGEEASPLCHPCAQAVLPVLAGEVERLLGRGAPQALDDLSAIEAGAHEDKAIASRATAPPWKWWTANSLRELHVDGRNRAGCVAYGQRHSDGVNDIAIDEPDMALIERAVNGLEERADALLRLAGEVRRLQEENARMRPVVEAAEAWNEDGALAAEVALSKALASMEPPRAGEEERDG